MRCAPAERRPRGRLAAALCALACAAGVPLLAHAQQPAGAVPLVTVPAAPGGAGAAVAPAPASRWSPQQLQQAFAAADVDGDGLLSRAEAQRLVLLPRSFEDMDANKDGVLSADEYLGGARP